MRAGRFMVAAALVAAGTAAPVLRAGGGELFDLMPRLEKGTRARYSITLATTTRGTGEELPEGGLTARLALSATVRLEVRSQEKGEALVALTYERLSVSSDAGLTGLMKSFDSANAAPQGESEPGPSLRLLVGAESLVRVESNGVVRSIEPPDGVTPASPSGAVLASFTTVQGLSEWLGPALTVNAADRVAPEGSRWLSETRREAQRGLETRLSTTYHLARVAGGQATLNLSGAGAVGTIPGGTLRGVDLKELKVEGVVLWDLSAGLASQVDRVEREVWTSQPEGRAVTTASVERRLLIRRLADEDGGAAPAPGAGGAGGQD